MEENNCNRGAQSRLPRVGPGDQNLIRKETLAAGRFAPGLQAHSSMRKCSFCQTCALSVTVRTLVVSLLTARSPHRECSSPKDHSDYIRSAAPPNAFLGDLF